MSLLALLFFLSADGVIPDPTITDVRIDNRIPAYLVRPSGEVKNAPAILFVHWYEPPHPTSNRSQFLEQAVQLARQGVVSLLPATLWSEPSWFNQRDPAQDYASSLAQVADLKLALDYLAAQPGVDPHNLVYVGHDFGMMYGILLGAQDSRPRAWALQAGTTDFADWFLLNQRQLSPAAQQEVRARLAPLAPLTHIAKLRTPLLLQFSTRDFYVPPASAAALANAAPTPKRILYYDAGHGLNAQAVADRMAWLRQLLSLPAPH